MRALAIITTIVGVLSLLFRLGGLCWYTFTMEGKLAQVTDAANSITRRYPIIAPLILIGLGYLGMQYI